MAFIRTIANRCERCLHRSDANCRPCISAWANSILRDIEAEGNEKEVDYTFGARMLRIIQILAKADKPLPAAKINIAEYCTKQLKYWTLQGMVKRGIITRLELGTRGGRTIYGYSLNKTRRP